MSLRLLPVALALFSTVIAVAIPVPAQQTLTDGPLTTTTATALNNDSILRMSKAGLDASLILQTIRTQPGHYATSPDDLIALKDAGVPQPVIAAMMAHNSGLADHASTAPLVVSPLSPENDEEGVYHKERDGHWTLINPELVRYKSGGWVKSTLTNNIIKKDRNGEVSGGQSGLVLRPGDELLILAPLNADAIEYQLLRFRLHANTREFRATTGGVFTSRDGIDRDQVAIQPKRIAPRTFAFTIPADIGGGEFGVLPPGAASVPGIAFAGKIYTFAITENK